MVNKKRPESVIVIDDEPDHLKFAAITLENDGFEVIRAQSGFEAVGLIAKKGFDLVLTDLMMEGMDGFAVIKNALKADPEAICVVITAHGSLENAMEALECGAYSFQQKPLNTKQLLHCVHRGLEKRRLRKELHMRNEQLEKLNRELDLKVLKATEELQEVNARIMTEMASLQEVDQLKSSFLDNVSHDLRSPLTLLKGYIQFLMTYEPLDSFGEVQRCLRPMDKATDHLGYLVDQLVDAAMLTSGKIKLKPASVNVMEILEEAAALSRKQADAKKLNLRTSWQGDAPPFVRAERGRLLQVLNNLLANACKFTPEGGSIQLRAWQENTGVHFCVQDTGPGISKKHQARIFDKFYQVDPSSTKEFNGMGLGLRISKDIVLLHRGKIWVESEVGRGTQFHFLLPSPAGRRKEA